MSDHDERGEPEETGTEREEPRRPPTRPEEPDDGLQQASVDIPRGEAIPPEPSD